MNKVVKISLITLLMSVGFFWGNANAEAKTAKATCLTNHAGFCRAIGLSSGKSKTVNFESAKSTLEDYYNKNSAVLGWSYMEGSGLTYYWVCVNTPIIKFVIDCTPNWGNCSVDCGTGTKSDGCGNSEKCNTQLCEVPGACESGLDMPSEGEKCVAGDDVLSSESSNLCTSGDLTSFNGDGTDANPWTWSCEGQHGSEVDKNCCARLVPGACGTGNGKIYSYPQGDFPIGFNFCNPDSASTIPASVILNQLTGDEPQAITTSWDCQTINAGTTDNACSATLNPPTVECGDKINGGMTNIKPTDPGLCSSLDNNVKVLPVVTLANGGNWTWGCEHNDFSGIKTAADACSRPSCIATAVSATSPIMISDSMNSVVSVSCPGADLCCTVTNNKNNISVTVCDGSTGQIQIEPGQNDLSSICWFDDGGEEDPGGPTDPTCDPATETCVVADLITVQTMCTARTCNARGTCQATPQIGSALSDCASSCNSNADCSSGRLIEIRP